MSETITHLTNKWLRSSDKPMPFAAELEPCVFYRITPKASPIIGLALIAITFLATIASVISSSGVPWLALISGVAAGALCIALPHVAGRWPGSQRLTNWEIKHERRSDRSLSPD